MTEQTNTRFIPLSKWEKYHDYPTVSGLRYLVFHASKNGFESVIRRNGRKILVNEEALFAYLDNLPSRSKPRANKPRADLSQVQHLSSELAPVPQDTQAVSEIDQPTPNMIEDIIAGQPSANIAAAVEESPDSNQASEPASEAIQETSVDDATPEVAAETGDEQYQS